MSERIEFALSLHRPWGWCIMHDTYDEKNCENRTWRPPPKLIGKRIAIHSAQKSNNAAAVRIAGAFGVGHLPLRCLEMGIIGTARLVGVVTLPNFNGEGWDDGDGWPFALTPKNMPPPHLRLVMGDWGEVIPQQAAGWFTGPYGWLLDQRLALPAAIPCNGAQRFWRVPKHLAESLE